MDSIASDEMNQIPALLRKAEAAMKDVGFFERLMGGRKDYDLAVELYRKCGQINKLAKKFDDAAICFKNAANAARLADDSNEEASCLQEAAHCVKRRSLEESTSIYVSAAAIMARNNRLVAAAKIFEMLGKSYEEYGKSGESASFFKEAADMFEAAEKSDSQRSSCMTKYAELNALAVEERNEDSESTAEELLNSAKILEQEAFQASKHNLLQYGAKELFLKAGILRLAAGDDAVDIRIAFDKYRDKNIHFVQSRECNLLVGLIDAYDERDSGTFQECIQKFDSVTKLDNFKVHFLLKVKEKLEAAPLGGITAHAGNGNAEEIFASASDDGGLDLS